MTTNVQVLRSSVTRKRPDPIYRPGSPYVNFADKQFGVVAVDGYPMDLLAIRIYTDTCDYFAGDLVVMSSNIWRCIRNCSARKFDPSFWEPLTGGTSGIGGGAALPAASDAGQVIASDSTTLHKWTAANIDGGIY